MDSFWGIRGSCFACCMFFCARLHEGIQDCEHRPPTILVKTTGSVRSQTKQITQNCNGQGEEGIGTDAHSFSKVQQQNCVPESISDNCRLVDASEASHVLSWNEIREGQAGRLAGWLAPIQWPFSPAAAAACQGAVNHVNGAFKATYPGPTGPRSHSASGISRGAFNVRNQQEGRLKRGPRRKGWGIFGRNGKRMTSRDGAVPASFGPNHSGLSLNGGPWACLSR